MTHALSPITGRTGTTPPGPVVRRPPWHTPDLMLRAAVRLRSGAARALTAPLRRSVARGERGDVPGWVLVTLMTAGLVLVLWGVARDRLTQVFNDAIDGVVSGR